MKQTLSAKGAFKPGDRIVSVYQRERARVKQEPVKVGTIVKHPKDWHPTYGCTGHHAVVWDHDATKEVLPYFDGEIDHA